MYSHSRIELYKQCPRRYKYNYIDHIKAGRNSAALAFGQAMHSALESIYKRFLSFGIFDLEQGITTFKKKLYHSVQTEPFPCSDEELGGMFVSGENILKNREYKGGEVLATEQKLNFHVGDYPFVGVVDRIDKKDGEYSIVDYKTGSKLPHIDDLKKNHQLLLYALAVQQNYGELPTTCSLEYVKFNEILDVPITQAAVGKAVQATILEIRTLERDHAFERKHSPLCGWCPYEDHCKAELAKEYSDQDDSQEDRLKKYLDLTALIGNLKNTLKTAETERDLIPLSEGKFLVCETTITVQNEISFKYPGVKDENYWELMALLAADEALGDVSIISAPRLKKYLKTAPDEILSEIQDLAKKESKRTIKIKKETE